MNLETSKNPLEYFLLRKLIHFLFGIISITVILFTPEIAAYLLSLAAFLFVVLDLWRRREGEWQKFFYSKFGKMLKPSESKRRITGATTFLMTVAGLLFSFHQNIVIVAILILAISDPLASIAGKLYPIKKIRNEKSLIGSITFFLSTVVIFYIAVPDLVMLLLIASLMVTLIELFAPELVENILIGFGAATILALL
jgi:dolichol kinase